MQQMKRQTKTIKTVADLLELVTKDNSEEAGAKSRTKGGYTVKSNPYANTVEVWKGSNRICKYNCNSYKLYNDAVTLSECNVANTVLDFFHHDYNVQMYHYKDRDSEGVAMLDFNQPIGTYSIVGPWGVVVWTLCNIDREVVFSEVREGQYSPVQVKVLREDKEDRDYFTFDGNRIYLEDIVRTPGDCTARTPREVREAERG